MSSLRMTDLLQTETPRPCLDDAVFTEFNTMHPDPVCIDATQVASLFMEMTIFNEPDKTEEEKEEIRFFESRLGESTGWQIASFFQFDFTTLGCCAPPFKCFVIEFDVREAMEVSAKNLGQTYTPRKTAEIGKQCAAFATFSHDEWMDEISSKGEYSKVDPTKRPLAYFDGPTMSDIERLPFRWMMAVTTWRYVPGTGLRGPLSTWVIPLDEEGKIFLDPERAADASNLMYAVAFGPKCKTDDMVSNQYAMSQGWTVIVPALMALTFLHTPRSTKQREGYHDLLDGEMPNAKQQRKYLERNFRPMTRWHVLDISPLREAVKRAHGGQMPTTFRDLKKALHVVRGHSATYMPNTYFGRKHDRPITVFKPSYRRGDIKAGILAKEYRLDTGGASGVAS